MTSHFRTPPSPLFLHPNLCPSQAQIEKNGGNGAKSLLLPPPLPFLSNPPPFQSPPEISSPSLPASQRLGWESLRKKRRGGAWGKSKNWGAVELASIRGWVLPIGRNAIEIKTRTTPAPISPPSALPGIKRKEGESGVFFLQTILGKGGYGGCARIKTIP